MIGYAFCGSFCTHKKSLEQLRCLKEQGYDVLPIMSDNVYEIDTYFGRAEDLIREVKEITGRDNGKRNRSFNCRC